MNIEKSNIQLAMSFTYDDLSLIFVSSAKSFVEETELSKMEAFRLGAIVSTIPTAIVTLKELSVGIEVQHGYIQNAIDIAKILEDFPTFIPYCIDKYINWYENLNIEEKYTFRRKVQYSYFYIDECNKYDEKEWKKLMKKLKVNYKEHLKF